MTIGNHFVALLCVTLIAAGQVLFKQTANFINSAGTINNRQVLSFGLAALSIYGIATVGWVFLLQTALLSRAYPYMALSFVIVALVSWLAFHEPMSGPYIGGLMLIVSGIFIIAVG